MGKTYRVAVIGHTGRGNYGHGLDTVWVGFPGVEIVGVADADPAGLAKAVARLKAPKGYADYRQMLDQLKPDLVAVAPRWLDQHRDMVVAAAERGVRGIYLEKPFCRTPAEADQIIAVCRKHGVRLALSHQTRYSPRLQVVWDLIQSGAIGRVVEFRGRGKEDSRGGGEDLWVLGSHVLNLMNYLGGDPQSCFATVLQDGRPIQARDVKPGGEGIGPLAGDEVHAMYRLSRGAVGYFDSIRRAGSNPPRFGLTIYGAQGVIDMSPGYLGPAYLLSDPSWSPGKSGKGWVPISSAGVGKPEPLADTGLHGGNLLAVSDLISAIEANREPEVNMYEGWTTIEMITAVFASQCQGTPVKFPLASRENPLTKM
jgi:predicted dehydrogenase